MKLSRPAAPFERVGIHGESVTLDTLGKVLVLPTGSDVLLPSFNEYVLNSNRLTIAESPFGGFKGTPADYSVGTISTPTDDIYLTDLSGTNPSKVLGAGELKELSLLSVDTVNHSITEEFIVVNNALDNNETILDACETAANWEMEIGAGEISVENGKIKAVGTADGDGKFRIYTTLITDLSSYKFLKLQINSSVNAQASATIWSTSGRKTWSGARFSLTENTDTIFVLPVSAPQGSAGTYPSTVVNPFDVAAISSIVIGVQGLTASQAVTLYIDSISGDVEKTATLEITVPDNLSATSLSLYTHNGTAYQLCSTHSLDGAYSQLSQTSANCTFLDSTKLDDVYGVAGGGRAYFPKGSAAETKAGSSGNITYSANLGTDKRIGLTVNLPPSDGGRTSFNKVRLKITAYYTADAEGNYSASFDFADSTNASYGLQNLSEPWIAIYSPTESVIDFYLFTHRPKNLEYKRDESGTIYELKLYPGNGQIYHGQITYPDSTIDSDLDDIPDVFGFYPAFLQTQDGQFFTLADGSYYVFLTSELSEGSLTKFLQSYGMVI